MFNGMRGADSRAAHGRETLPITANSRFMAIYRGVGGVRRFHHVQDLRAILPVTHRIGPVLAEPTSWAVLACGQDGEGVSKCTYHDTILWVLVKRHSIECTACDAVVSRGRTARLPKNARAFGPR
jgi:hypothetical protein